MDNRLVEKLSEIIKENIAYSFMILYLAAVFTVFGIQQVLNKEESTDIIDIAGEGVQEDTEKNVYVEISGAVNKPGVYELSSESRLAEVVSQANGFSKDASEEWITKYINLSGKITDAQKIYIPFKWEDPAEAVNGRDVAVLTNPYIDRQAVPAGDPAVGSGGQEEVSGKVNINTASLEDIDALPGIGPVYAARIIENRPYNDFQALEESSEIPKKVLEKIKDQIGY